MKIFDIICIGAGPAGIIAAISISEHDKSSVLIERNNKIAKKLLITGKGRCNITNTAPLDRFIEKFDKEGLFFRSAFQIFFNNELFGFFGSLGLDLKEERQGRVFPVSDKAASVVEALNIALSKSNTKIIYDERVQNIKKEDGIFKISFFSKKDIYAKKIIIATGGASYKETGSTGDGFCIAKELGHTIKPLFPALVPLKTKETWVKELQGLSLRNVRIEFAYDKKHITSSIGEMLFTHFGVSGPLVLDLSGRISKLLSKHKKVRLLIDLKPGIEQSELTDKLIELFCRQGKAYFKNILKEFLPHRLIPVFMELAKIDPCKSGSQITKKDRDKIVQLLKKLPLTISGTLGIDYGMVTGGGVSIKEIDPRTMESKIVKGLYFAGEIIEGCAPSGGYNLQQAFSTGYLAGVSACAN